MNQRGINDTKGKSKITAKEVIAARRLYKNNPELTMQEIKDKLGLKIHIVMVGRAIRGITHGHLDMCGLPVRPFGTKGPKAAKKPAAPKKATSEAKPAKKAVAAKKPKETKPAKPKDTKQPKAAKPAKQDQPAAVPATATEATA